MNERTVYEVAQATRFTYRAVARRAAELLAAGTEGVRVVPGHGRGGIEYRISDSVVAMLAQERPRRWKCAWCSGQAETRDEDGDPCCASCAAKPGPQAA